MSLSNQIGRELSIVVDFPVIDDPNGAVLIAHGLFPRDQINNLQPFVAQPHGARGVNAVSVWSSMIDLA
jgi:hypothetical protein